jgi:hypothetical protein
LLILSGTAVLLLAVTGKTTHWLAGYAAPYFVALRPRLD